MSSSIMTEKPPAIKMHRISNVPTALQSSRNHPFVTFNNQNSVIMIMSLPIYNLLCLLHDNRIFAFKSRQLFEEDLSSLSEMNLLLNLLTTPKYRAMNIMYILFRLLDSASFVLIIILSINKMEFAIPSSSQVALLSAIGLEVFYDVMLYTDRYWTLQRLSIHIGLVLYFIYVIIVAFKNSYGEYTAEDLFLVTTVLSIRFCAFIFEECVDIAIDAEVHNDILKLQKSRDNEELNKAKFTNTGEEIKANTMKTMEENEKPTCKETGYFTLFSYSNIKNYLDVSNAIKFPQDAKFVGSIFAWGPSSVFTENVWKRDPYPRWFVCMLCFIPFILSAFLFLLVALLCFAAFLIPVIFGFIVSLFYIFTCNFRGSKIITTLNDFWEELTHF